MDIVKQSLAITFVFVLLWVALWFLRKKGAVRIGLARRSSAPDILETQGRLALSAQHSVHVIRVGERELVLAVHPQGVTLLCELTAGSVRKGAGGA
jgi:flagellar biosynthetic protein FliO